MLRRSGLFGAAALFLLALPALYLLSGRAEPAGGGPLPVLEAYLRAGYARDYPAAYRHISSEDRRLKDEKSYSRERGTFGGFTLEAARKLAGYIVITPLEEKASAGRARLRVRFRVPDAAKLAPVLLDWEVDRLNSLSPAGRRELLAAVDRLGQNGQLAMIEGEESFELVREGDGWKVFLDWAAGVNLAFQALVPRAAPVDALLPQPELLAQPGELLNVALKIRNRSDREVYARIGHVIQPPEAAEHLDMVECGFLLPVSLAPRSEQEFLTTYLLRGDLPEGVRRIQVTYDFRVQE